MRSWGLGLEHRNLGNTQFSPYTTETSHLGVSVFHQLNSGTFTSLTRQDRSGKTREDHSRTSETRPFGFGSVTSPFSHLKTALNVFYEGQSLKPLWNFFFFPRERVDFFLHCFQKKFPGCRAFLKIHMRSSVLCLFCRQNTLPGSLWQRQPCNSEIPDSSSLSDTDVSGYQCGPALPDCT